MTSNKHIHFKESEIYIAFCDESKNKKRFTENLTISKKKTKSYINCTLGQGFNKRSYVLKFHSTVLLETNNPGDSKLLEISQRIFHNIEVPQGKGNEKWFSLTFIALDFVRDKRNKVLSQEMLFRESVNAYFN